MSIQLKIISNGVRDGDNLLLGIEYFSGMQQKWYASYHFFMSLHKFIENLVSFNRRIYPF